MNIKQELRKLTAATGTCVTLSLNTHRTFPENQQDAIVLKNLINEAQEKVISHFGKRDPKAILEKLATIEEQIDHRHNMESLHIFISEDITSIHKSPLPTAKDQVVIAEKFAVNGLMKNLLRTQHYLILVLKQSGTHLYAAVNDAIAFEVTGRFPFPENPYEIKDTLQRSDAKAVDNKLKEYFNIIDKAVVEEADAREQKVIVLATADNYSKLLEVADKREVYIDNVDLDYSNSTTHQIVQAAWPVVDHHAKKRRLEAIEEVKEAVAQGKVDTEIGNIYRSAKSGRGAVLVMHSDFDKTIKVIDDQNIEVVENPQDDKLYKDFNSLIAWEVFEKGGDVVYTSQNEIKDLGNIVLKQRY